VPEKYSKTNIITLLATTPLNTFITAYCVDACVILQ